MIGEKFGGFVFGYLDWNELQKIRHVHILDLSLHGNHKLEMDAYCECFNVTNSLNL